MKRIFSIIATLSMLTGCGYYFAPLDDLKLLHEDGVVAAGIYGDVGFIAVLREGEREGVSLCVEEEEQAFRARAYLVPVESDFLVVMSELEVWNDDRWAPVFGDLMFLGKYDAGRYSIYDPVRRYVDHGIETPFEMGCDFGNQPNTTLSAYNMTPLCLAPDVTSDDIVEWGSELNHLGQPFASFSRSTSLESDRVSRCADPSG